MLSISQVYLDLRFILDESKNKFGGERSRLWLVGAGEAGRGSMDDLVNQ